MATINIQDLTKDQEISRDEMKVAFGGRSDEPIMDGPFVSSDPFATTDPNQTDWSGWPTDNPNPFAGRRAIYMPGVGYILLPKKSGPVQ